MPTNDANLDSILSAGTTAPPFTLPRSIQQTVSLADFRGRPVVLVFYAADWSPVCGDQLAVYNEVIDEFTRYGAQLIGISVDGVFCHQAYTKDRQLEFPLLADFEPKGKVSRMFGAYNSTLGVSERALFVVDRDGVIRWSFLSPMDENPGAAGILSALEALQTPAGRSP